MDYTRYNSPRFIYPALSVTTVLLVLVFFFPGSHNTHRWIRFGGFFTFQPSEIAKPVLVLFLAWFLHTRLDAMRDWKHTLLRAAMMPVVFIVLIVSQPDLGTALVLAGVTAHDAGAGGHGVEVPGRRRRPRRCPRWPRCCFWFRGAASACWSFSIPTADPQGAGFHINQSLIAVGTGGLTGRGYMEGMQKLFYLPEASTDFIFANIAEELGFIGAISIVLLFVVFGVRGLRTAFRSQDPFARLVAFGITIDHPAAGVLQHQRGALAGAHQGNSAAADLLRRDLAFLHAGQHRHPAQHHQEGGLRKQGTGVTDQRTENRKRGTGNREQRSGLCNKGTASAGPQMSQ